MAFQTVPSQSELQSSIPAGRSATVIKEYVRSAPAFGPGSVEYTQRQMEELEMLKSEGEAPISTSSRQADSYAGAGSYF